MARFDNVEDRRHDWIGSWKVEQLRYYALTYEDIGRTVIFSSHNKKEAGTLVGWKNGLVFARYSKGDTAAAAKPSELVFGVKPLDGDLTRGERKDPT